MAALKNIFGKEGADSVRTTAKYSKLTQDLSDNEAEDDEVYSAVTNGAGKTKTRNGRQKGESIEMTILETTRDVNKTKVRISGKSKCTIAWFIVPLVIALVIGVGFGTYPLLKKHGFFGGSTHDRPVRTQNWIREFDNIGTESCVRLYDVNKDGKDDILLGITEGVHMQEYDPELGPDYICKKIGSKSPCLGAVIALRGFDGKPLWRVNTTFEPFEINCSIDDFNGDGHLDCIASGRKATMTAIDPIKGKAIWHEDMSVLEQGWNNYGVQGLPDFDNDGVREILLPHGGNPSIPPEVTTRESGRLIMISGKTGKMLGKKYLKMPEDKELYMSPVIHRRRDGSQYILFGSGGETVPGSLLAISVPDFYRYVFELPAKEDVPNIGKDITYAPWGEMTPNADGIIEIYRSSSKGIMVPPVLVDLTHDEVKDIVMSGYDGTITVFNGETLELIWRVKYAGYESYSSPAPGFFNDDSVLDLMVYLSQGTWPGYNHSLAVVLDGKTGETLWSLVTTMYEMSSPLALHTKYPNRDAYVFRVQGRLGKYVPDINGVIHGIQPQRIIHRRKKSVPQKYNNKKNYKDDKITKEEINDLLDNDIFYNTNKKQFDAVQQTGFRASSMLRKRQADDLSRTYQPAPSNQESENVNQGQESTSNKAEHLRCTDDLQVFDTEIFIMDRTTMSAPIQLFSMGANKLNYTITKDDWKKISENINHERGKDGGSSQQSLYEDREEAQVCVVLKPTEMSTGAIGDLDGDGTLDMVAVYNRAGQIRDPKTESYLAMKFTIAIAKVNLEDKVSKNKAIKVDANINKNLHAWSTEQGLEKVKFLPPSEQPWMAYMGNTGDSIY
ncbi:unnamed protein product [Owenia fusiformis]|uniref:FAM234A/B beta-propeller domain-containing protein n=2 Tax=Owenia fusiformis TaxID=6347 RepID=A0A8S4PQ53_OWEFU|nr:unnamed protein product [Owenia fusiformis]